MISNTYQANSQTDLVFLHGFEFVSRLNDTGITWAGEATPGNNTDCISNTMSWLQDCDKGRDNTHNIDSDGLAGFSFTKLDTNGDPLAATASSWICVRDNITGLTWEVKTDDNSIHSKDNTYQWGGLTAIGRDHPNRQGTYSDEWNTLIETSNNTNFCGYSNWRVPTFSELSSITNRGTHDPAIDINYFPHTESNEYWSSSPISSVSSDALLVKFIDGGQNSDVRFNSYRVRLVYSNQ